MTEHSIEFVKQAKKEVWCEYQRRVKALGCDLSHGIGWDDFGNFTISLNIFKEGGVDEKLIKKLETLLPSEHKGYKVIKSYGDIVKTK